MLEVLKETPERGLGAAALAERLRHKGYDGAIAVFGQEPCQPYQRPPLSKKYLGGEWDFERLALRPPAVGRRESFHESARCECWLPAVPGSSDPT